MRDLKVVASNLCFRFTVQRQKIGEGGGGGGGEGERKGGKGGKETEIVKRGCLGTMPAKCI